MSLAAPSNYLIRGITFTKATQTVTNPLNAGGSSDVFDARGYTKKIIYLRSTLNQSVVITLKSLKAESDSQSRTIGNTITLTDGSGTAQTAEIHLTDYHPFLRVDYDPAADATGALLFEIHAQGD